MKIKLHNSFAFSFKNQDEDEKMLSKDSKECFFFFKEKAFLFKFDLDSPDELGWELQEFTIRFIGTEDEEQEEILFGTYFVLDIQENKKMILKNGKKLMNWWKPFPKLNLCFAGIQNDGIYIICNKFTKWALKTYAFFTSRKNRFKPSISGFI